MVTMYDNRYCYAITVNNGRDSLISAMRPIYDPLLNFVPREDMENRDDHDFLFLLKIRIFEKTHVLFFYPHKRKKTLIFHALGIFMSAKSFL